MILDTVTKTLELVLGTAQTTTAMPVTIDYVDMTTTTTVPGSLDFASNGTTIVTIGPAPAASTQRKFNLITVYNADSISKEVTIRLNNNTVLRPIVVVSLSVGDMLSYTDTVGWKVTDTYGAIHTVATADVGAAIAAAPSKTTPIGADKIGIWDSVSGLLNGVLFSNLNLLWANIAGSASQVFSVAPATAASHAVRAEQIIGRNTVVNGGCEIAQQNGTTLITPATGTWPIDNVSFSSTQASKLQSQQVTNQLVALGATHALKWTVLAQYTPISTDAISESHPIEGLNFARFAYGTANAKVASLQFKVNAPTGTYSGAIQNYARTRSYPFSFTITAGDVAAGGKLVKIENIPGDTGGSWVGATNAGAAYITFDLGSGSNFKGTADTWAGADYRGVTGASNLVSQANGTAMAITDVQFEQSAFCSRYERKLIGLVSEECNRYLKYNNLSGVVAGFTVSAGYFKANIPGAMRDAPQFTNTGTLNFRYGGTDYAAAVLSSSVSGNTIELYGSATGAVNGNVGYLYALTWMLDARI